VFPLGGYSPYTGTVKTYKNKIHINEIIETTANTSTHITKTSTQLLKHPHITKPTHTQTHTSQNKYKQPQYSSLAPEFYMPTFRNNVPSSQADRCRIHSTPTRLWRWNIQSVPKRRHIKFRRRGITQKQAYSIQNKAKVWNQENHSTRHTPNEIVTIQSSTFSIRSP